jgi:hypothetical protein
MATPCVNAMLDHKDLRSIMHGDIKMRIVMQLIFPSVAMPMLVYAVSFNQFMTVIYPNSTLKIKTKNNDTIHRYETTTELRTV